MRRQLLCLAPILVMAACSSKYDVPGEPEMSSHFAAASDIQAAVVRGDLGAAAGPAEWLATHVTPTVPAGSEIALVELQAAAESVVRTCEARPGREDVRSPVDYPTVGCRDATILEAAVATARVAQSCGKCHSRNAPRTLGEAYLVIPTTAVSTPHMGLHAWAVDRMWEGMVRPSKKAWIAGARALSEAEWLPASVLASHIAAEMRLADDVEYLDRAAHNLAATAMDAETPDDIAKAYGQLIATCADCHAQTGVEFTTVPAYRVTNIPAKSGAD